ncbi:hypothetical protein [Paraburkholderia sp. Ac-20347]|uniref:hypothetical protein n=1 Tax=Paraburkholderia sp. Ac-20347 TaxID=2703892 RepID=UPI001981893C|nr:hypothetical protein [Paraburkholderia sp. Ac-20347]MBN3809595.1 hypothetical protein [Paraburkholderia sp. Ac-20347]
MKARHSHSFLPDAQTAPPQTAPGEIDIEGLAGEALGATFLAQWRALYIDHQERAPRFIAQRMDSATTTRQRKLLEDSVAGFHTAIDTALKAFESYAQAIQTTLKQCSGAGFLPPEIATLLIDYANNVRVMGSGFDFEAMPSLEKRIQQYDALIQDALVWATHQSEYIAKQGLSTLFAIKTCDELTAVWKRSSTQLETLCSDLQPMQTGTT